MIFFRKYQNVIAEEVSLTTLWRLQRKNQKQRKWSTNLEKTRKKANRWEENVIYCLIESWLLNSAAAGKFEWNFRQILVIDGWGISCEIALLWMSLNFTDESTLVQVMAWCRQASSHYLSQCWPRSLSPYVVTRPQWVNSLASGRYQG